MAGKSAKWRVDRLKNGTPGPSLLALGQTHAEVALSRCQPLLNGLLFLVGYVVAVQYPPTYLFWLGVPPSLLAGYGALIVVKLGIYLACSAFILMTIDGCGASRIFAALLFPFLISFGVAVNNFALRVSILWNWLPALGAHGWWLQGTLFGITAGLLVSIPIAFVYRTRVVSLSAVVLAPAVAHTAANHLFGCHAHPSNGNLVLDGWSYIAFLFAVALVYKLIKRLGFNTDPARLVTTSA